MNQILINNIPLTPFKGGLGSRIECPLEGTVGVFSLMRIRIITEK